MKYRRLLAVLLAASVLLVIGQSSAEAAINPMISFQGKLTNADGTNVTNGNYSIRFRIYTDPTADTGACANTCKWEETQGTVAVSGGVFHVNLGSSTALPGSVDFNGSALYLGVKVSSDAEMTPRVRLTATPYAFNSDTLDGLDSANFVQLSGGNVNIGSGTLTSGAVNGVTIGSTIQPSAAGALTVRSNGSNALNFTAGAASTWDIGNNLLSLQTTNNGAITTGTGLWTQGGNLTFSGASARTITGPSTGGLTLTVGSGPLSLSTTTSGTLSLSSAGALNLTAAAASTWSTGGNALTVTSSNFNVSSAGAISAATSTNTINNLVINNGSLTNVGANITASGALTVASGGSSALSFDSASNTIQIAATDTTIQRAASGTFTLDLNNAAATTLTVTNSNGTGVASLTVEGDITATGVFKHGANTGMSTTCSGGQFLQNPVVSGGLVTGGSCAAGGSSSPGGSDTQIQFNNSGNFGGDADFVWNSSTNTLTLGGTGTGVIIQAVTSEPPTPSAGTLRIYTKDVAGRVMPKWVGPSGVDTPFQAGLGFNRISMVTPAGGTNCSTGVSAIGTIVTGAGTCANPTPTTTNLLNSTRRITYSSGTTPGTVAYHRQGMLQVWRGNASSLGGFFYTTRFATSTLASGNRAFSGLADSINNPTNVDPTTSTTPGKIGMAINASTGNWSLVHNATGTAPTVIALGANFPVDITSLYELILFSAPNGSTIGYRVTNVSTGNQTSGAISTNIPSNTTFLAPLFWITNNASAAAAVIASSGWYLESDF